MGLKFAKIFLLFYFKRSHVILEFRIAWLFYLHKITSCMFSTISMKLAVFTVTNDQLIGTVNLSKLITAQHHQTIIDVKCSPACNSFCQKRKMFFLCLGKLNSPILKVLKKHLVLLLWIQFQTISFSVKNSFTGQHGVLQSKSLSLPFLEDFFLSVEAWLLKISLQESRATSYNGGKWKIKPNLEDRILEKFHHTLFDL